MLKRRYRYTTDGTRAQDRFRYAIHMLKCRFRYAEHVLKRRFRYAVPRMVHVLNADSGTCYTCSNTYYRYLVHVLNADSGMRYRCPKAWGSTGARKIIHTYRVKYLHPQPLSI